MKRQVDSLSKEEIEMVLRHRERGSSPHRAFMRKVGYVVISAVSVLVVVAWFQAAELQHEGSTKRISAPLSWFQSLLKN